LAGSELRAIITRKNAWLGFQAKDQETKPLKEEFIQFAPLFTALPRRPETVERSFMQNNAATGTVLFQAGDNADGLYLVGNGFVRLFTAGGSTLATLGQAAYWAKTASTAHFLMMSAPMRSLRWSTGS
jgi:hypothetical protein